MKPKTLVLPACATVVLTVLLLVQRQKIAEVEARTLQLVQAVEAAAARGRPESLVGTISSRRSLPPAIDWQLMSELIDPRNRSGLFAEQRLLLLNQRIRRMSADELIEAIADLDASRPEMRSGMELGGKLLSALAEKDPAAALNGILRNRDVRSVYDSGNLFTILQDWARDDAASAENWLDAAIAAGDFGKRSLEGDNHRWSRSEVALMSTLPGTSPEVISKRLAAMSPDDRQRVFDAYGDHFWNGSTTLSKDELINFSEMVRTHIPTTLQSEYLVKPVPSLVIHGGYKEVDAYLDSHAATPDERKLAIGRAATPLLSKLARDHQLTVVSLAGFEDWAARHTPDSVKSSMAMALVNSSHGFSGFDRIANLASSYGESHDGDKLLVEFLKTMPSVHRRDGAEWARTNIADTERRAAILKQLEAPGP